VDFDIIGEMLIRYSDSAGSGKRIGVQRDDTVAV